MEISDYFINASLSCKGVFVVMKFASKGHKERFLQETDKASVSYLLSVIPDLHNMTEEGISILAKQEIVLICAELDL